MTASAFDLTGRRVLITGAARGIGTATATVCAALGAEVLLVDRESSESIAEALRRKGFKASASTADVANRAEMAALADKTGQVDAMVLNAAICPWGDDWATDPDWDDSFERVTRVNVLGGLNGVRAFIAGMKQRRWGRIVFVGSLAGRMGGLIAGPHYVASKGAVHALVKWLARQLGPHNILVNGVAPASVTTQMMADQVVDLARIPLGRMGRADEIAWPIAFLCSEAASYMCGTVLDVNGGVYMAP